MKNGFTLFAGIFAVIALSWAGLLLPAHRQYGHLAPFKDPVEETLYPQPSSGLAAQGREVYADLGCVYCHTQQVRRADFGADLDRKWGERQSVARDYIQESRVFLGSSRLGPDLRNVGARIPEAGYFYKLLYAPSSISKGSAMPPHAFLFETRKIVGERSAQALKVNTAPGYEVVPTPRAEALVAYLLSLKDTYDYPEERQKNTPPATRPEHGGAAPKKEEGHKQ